MDIVLPGNLSIDELISLSNETDIKDVELNCVKNANEKGIYFNLPAEGMALIRNRLTENNLNVYSLSIKCNFADIVARKGDEDVDILAKELLFAKKSIDLLRYFGGSVLKVELQPLDKADMPENTLRSIANWLNSISRYASRSAGIADKEYKTVKIAYKPVCSECSLFNSVLEIHSGINNRAVGIALEIDGTTDESECLKLFGEVNLCELTINYITIDPTVDREFYKKILKEAAMSYDGNYAVISKIPPIKVLSHIKQDLKEIKFDTTMIDFLKQSYPSSVARAFKKCGSSCVTPESDVIAGTTGTWTYVYTAGEEGIRTGGGIKLRFHHSTDWQPFQLKNPDAGGYVGIRSNGSACLKQEILWEEACQVLKITVSEGVLHCGDTITITVGDSSKGSRAQTFDQKKFVFFTAVDCTGYGYYFELVNPPYLKITGGKAEKIKVVAPSTVYAGEEFDAGIRVEDKYFNLASDFNGNFRFTVDGMDYPDAKFVISADSDSVLTIKGIRFDKCGCHVIEVKEENNKLSAVSNYIKCIDKDTGEYKIFWGDIHGHTSLMDSVGTVDEYYSFARDVAFLDFCCLSEHIDSFSMGRQASNDFQWEELKRGVRQYNLPGKFITILGYENSMDWDANVYFDTEDAPWYVSSFPKKLFEFAHENNAIVVPHMTTYPQRARGYDWTFFDPEVVPVIEIYSTHGASEYYGGEKPLSDCEPGGYAQDALNMGHKIGFIGSGDGHDCKPGNSPSGRYINGLVAVFVKELTRESIIDAIRKRRCYATTNERILAYFTLNGHMMGEEIKLDGSRAEERVIEVSVHGTDMLKEISIIKDGRELYTFAAKGRIAEFMYTDRSDNEKNAYYYVRITQEKGGMAWLSPIWVDII